MNKINITYVVLPIQICWLFNKSWYFLFQLSHKKRSEDISPIFTTGKIAEQTLKRNLACLSLSLIILVGLWHLLNIYYQFWKKINLKECLALFLQLLSLKFTKKKERKKNSPCQWRCLITKENCYLCSILAWKHPSFLLFLPLIVKIQEKLWVSESSG